MRRGRFPPHWHQPLQGSCLLVVKTTLRPQLGQTLNLTPQLLQSIRLLQLTAQQLELELLQALEQNPMLERDEGDELGEADIDPLDAAPADSAVETASWDELPEAAFLSGPGSGTPDGELDATARIAAGESTDPRVRLLERLALHWAPEDLRMAAWWLDRCSDVGLLEAPHQRLLIEGADELGVDADELEMVRQRLLHGEWPGMCAETAAECLQAQLALRADTPAVRLARRIVAETLDLLASGQVARLAAHLGEEPALVSAAIAEIRSLRPTPVDDSATPAAEHIIPDLVATFVGGEWRVALNERALPRVRIAAHCERALAGAPGDNSALRGLLEEARWLLRGISMRNDTLLRTGQVLVRRQRGFLERGAEALAPLTLNEVAEEISMHESTVSRVTSGKYIQTPRGVLELKQFFAVRLEGAEVSGNAVRAMVKRLIDNEPPDAPLADETIAVLLARNGVRVARRTVAKYRDQLAIGPARSRMRTPSGGAPAEASR